jgi:hypothetical protein
VNLPEHVDPYDALLAVSNERRRAPVGGISRLQLAFAALKLLAAPVAPADWQERLKPVAIELADPHRLGGEDEVTAAIVNALARAARIDDDEQQWSDVVHNAGDQLHPDLRAIDVASCRSELRIVDDEVLTRVEMRLVVRNSRSLDELAWAVIPTTGRTSMTFTVPSSGGRIATQTTGRRLAAISRQPRASGGASTRNGWAVARPAGSPIPIWASAGDGRTAN